MAVASIGPIQIGKYLSPCVSFSRTMGWFVGISTRLRPSKRLARCLYSGPCLKALPLSTYTRYLDAPPSTLADALAAGMRKPGVQPAEPLSPPASGACTPEFGLSLIVRGESAVSGAHLCLAGEQRRGQAVTGEPCLGKGGLQQRAVQPERQ